MWLPWVRQRRPLSPTLERQLLAISARQMDRRLQPRKHRLKRRLYGTTRPGTLLKQLVPVKTDHWDVTQPGYLEIDLVSHSGASAAGEFLHTLDAVDIHTGWVERQAVMGKGQHGILQALTTIAQQLPFALRGLDSDNGSEFINGHLVAFCARRAIQFTRSRPYKKDDNAHIEQKNWTHVRKLIGWDRYETLEAQQALNALYADLRLFQNLFQPSLKLQRKERRGSRRLRRYDAPQTPFARVQASAAIDAAKVAALERLFQQTDPFVLAQHWAAPGSLGDSPQPSLAGRPSIGRPVARLDLQSTSAAVSSRRGRNVDTHKWRRSHDRLGRQGNGRGEFRSNTTSPSR